MRTFPITSDDVPQRLDRFVRKLLPWASLSLIYRLIRKGDIRLNAKKTQRNAPLMVGNTIEIRLRDTDIDTLLRPSDEPKTLPKGSGIEKRDIIYEDRHILVINKCAGLNVHPGDHKSDEVSLIERVHDYLANKPSESLTFRPSLAHRIDRDTSGIVLIGKTKIALDSLTKQFREGTVKKRYIAVCAGQIAKGEGTIRKRLLRTDGERSGATVCVDETGQEAITRYRVLGTTVRGDYTIIECLPETGRTHQIRVHLSSIGCPIIGDRTYGNAGINSNAKREYGIVRHLLHAESVSFLHPVKHIMVTYRARMREDMAGLIGDLTP